VGISMVHQELNLVPQMNAAQNIFLGREKGSRQFRQIINWRDMRRAAHELLQQVGADVDVSVPVRRLSIAQRQMVEIAKALSTNADILVMDEPTSSLTDKEIAELFRVLRNLTARGVSIIFVSHRMEEIFEISDRVTVLRDGKNIGTRIIAEIMPDDVITMMVGRDLSSMYPKEHIPHGEEILHLSDVNLTDALHHIHFVTHAGEIVGIAGLVGAGRSELARVIFGADQPTSGTIMLRGQPIRFATPRDAIQRGIGLLTADRKGQGLVLGLPITVNTSLARLDKVSRFNILNRGAQRRVAAKYVADLHIRPGDIHRKTRYLSGGNQQKVVLSKWLFSDADVLVFDEPTRGVDVGAKVEIYQLMNQMVRAGKCLIIISSELPEIIGMSDRILVMREGRFVREFTRSADHEWHDTIKQDILRYAMGDVADVGNVGNVETAGEIHQ
jgi:ribose transport system ATP-binding protein